MLEGCPFCGKEKGCQHVFGMVDRSSVEVHGGYIFKREHELRRAVVERAYQLLQKSGEKLPWQLARVIVEVETARQAESASELADLINDDAFWDLMDHLFCDDNDVDWFSNDTDEDDDRHNPDRDRPGSWSLERRYFSRDPKATFARVVAAIRALK